MDLQKGNLVSVHLDQVREVISMEEVEIIYQSNKKILEEYKISDKKKKLLAEGVSVGSKIGVGKVNFLKSAADIGKFKEGEQFEAFGMLCQAAVNDHYWWIEADDLTIQLGPSPRAYIADSWLRKIVPPKEKLSNKTEKELDIFA